MQGLAIALSLAAVATISVASPGLAGGFAVTTLDAVPSRVQVGQTYRIGFMMRQHGTAPFTGGSPRTLIAQGPRSLSFASIADAAPGYHVSEVTSSTAGE